MPDGKTMSARCMMAAGGLMRQEMSANGREMVMITNLEKGIILTFMKKQKIAVQVHVKDIPKALRDQMLKQNYHFAEMKKMVRTAEKELGDKTIDGVKVKGYRVKNEDMVVDFWVDAKTAMPVRMEGDMTSAGMKFVMSDIEFVKTVDPGIFSVEVPKGYKIEQQQTVSMKPADIEGITDMFKAWVQIRDGTFPDAINPALFATDTQKHAKKLEDAGTSSKESHVLFGRMAKTVSNRLVGVIMLMQSNETFCYRGKGVKLGDKETAVLWYKPEGKDKYVVMFGDLHVEQVLKKDLPPKAATAPAAPK